MARLQNLSRNREEELGTILDRGLKLLTGKKMKPLGDCPDSETFARFVQGQVDLATEKNINSHIAFCDECYREYLALAEPEDVMKEIEQEVNSDKIVAPPERSPEAWRRLMAGLKSFVIDLGKAYAPGTLVGAIRIVSGGPELAVKGKKTSKRISKVLEAGVGDNTYSVELGARRDGALYCDIAGHQTPNKKPLYVALRLESGEALHAAQTNIHGNLHFSLPGTRVPRDVGVLDLNLEGAEHLIAFRMPPVHASS